MQLNVLLVQLTLLSKLDVTFTLVSKYKPKKPTATRPKNVDSQQRESYVSGVCKTGVDDLTLYKLNFDQCVEECQARPMCVSINVYVKLDVCRINFVTHPKLGHCPKYIYSEKKNWKRKMKKGCEEQICDINEKCIITNDKPKCTPTECRQIYGIQNGVMFGNHVMFGKKRGFRCNKGFNLIGPSSVTCKSDGNWSDDTPTCEKLTKKRKKTTQTTTSSTTTPQSSTKSNTLGSKTSIKTPYKPITHTQTRKPRKIIVSKTDDVTSDNSSTDMQTTTLSNKDMATSGNSNAETHLAVVSDITSSKDDAAKPDKANAETQTKALSNTEAETPNNSNTETSYIAITKTEGLTSDKAYANTQTTALSIYIANAKTDAATSDKSSAVTQTTEPSNIHDNRQMNEPPCSEADMDTDTGNGDRRSNTGPIDDNCRPSENESSNANRIKGGKYKCEFGQVLLISRGVCIPPSECTPPKTFAHTYQTYLDTNIDVPTLSIEWRDNTGECAEACVAMEFCVAFTAKYEGKSTTNTLPGNYQCKYFDASFIMQDPKKHTRHITFVRDCSDTDYDVNNDGNTDVTEPTSTWKQCELGFVYSYSTQDCRKGCTQNADSFQHYKGVRIDTRENFETSVREGVSVETIEDCKRICRKILECNTITAKNEDKSTTNTLPGNYRCKYFDMSFNMQDPKKHTGHITFVRDCSDTDHDVSNDVNTDVTEPASTWKQCDLGFVYSYSTQDCRKGCTQNADSFQHYKNVRIDTRTNLETSVREGVSVETICRKILECNTMTVGELNGHTYRCTFLDLKKLEIVPHRDSNIYRRDCL